MSEEEIRRRQTNQVDMLNGSLWDKILVFALPLAASSILQQLFNSADVAVAGRFAGSQALAAVGSNSYVINLLINLFVGLSVGANVIIANYIGKKHYHKISEAVHTAVALALVSGVFLLVIGIVLAKPILIWMDTPDDVIELAVLYLRIYFLGMPFIMIYNFGSAILRSKGDTKRPLYCLIISGIVNVLLNLLLVIVFQLSVAGVGIATVISNGISAGIVFYILLHEEERFRLDIKKLSIKKEHLMGIVKVGAPAGLQGMVFSLSNVCIQTAINSFGSGAIAGSAAALNFESFTYFVANAFSQAAVTFTSQNYGAGKVDRCKKVFRLSMVSGLAITAVMSVCFVLGRGFFIRLYSVDPEVLEYAYIRMTHVLILECMPCLYEIGGAALRGIGHSLLPAVLTIIGSCGVRVLWIYTVFRVFGSYEMLMNVYPVSWVITSVSVLGAYFIIRRRAFAAVQKADNEVYS